MKEIDSEIQTAAIAYRPYSTAEVVAKVLESDFRSLKDAFVHQMHALTDEMLCRVSVHKVDLFTHLGKRFLPDGYWGQAKPHGEAPHVFMTFDDGPNPDSTPQLLELLESHGVQATFFLIGENCARYPHLVKRIHDAGHTIGNHTYSHLLLPLLSAQEIELEIIRCNEIIAEITGETPKILRPPFGLMDERTAAVLRKLDMTPVYWSSAPEDWLNPGSRRVIRRVMWKITDGTLIVLHEGTLLAQQTLNAANEIISRCKSRGYDFSTVNGRAGLQTTNR